MTTIRIMTIRNNDSGEEGSETVRAGEKDFEALARVFEGDSSLFNHYTVTFQNYEPITVERQLLEKKYLAIEDRLQELVEELATRNREIERLSGNVVVTTGQLEQITSLEVKHRDEIRELQTENDLLRGENSDLKQGTRPIPMPPKALRMTPGMEG